MFIDCTPWGHQSRASLVSRIWSYNIAPRYSAGEPRPHPHLIPVPGGEEAQTEDSLACSLVVKPFRRHMTSYTLLNSGRHSLAWDNSGLTWSAGNTVQLEMWVTE